LGLPGDLQLQAVATALQRRGATVISFNSEVVERRLPVSADDGAIRLDGVAMAGLTALYVRSLPSPHPPVVEIDGDLVLRRDWFAEFMQARERSGFLLATLLCLEEAGVRLVNSPQAGMALQSKPLQLAILRRLGARVPRTLISNDPQHVRAFHARQAAAGRAVIFKPLLGGAITRLLDPGVLEQLERVREAPVIFQERIDGDDIRVVVIGGSVVSAVAIRTPHQHLDFRDDPVYSAGEARYETVSLPPAVQTLCVAATAACGLRFAGLDLKRTAAGEWVVLELNSSPIYLDVERKIGDPISDSLAALLLDPGPPEPGPIKQPA
jgi:glutathione synthase/RimK-type ligase-like ATP-grasp enzyme